MKYLVYLLFTVVIMTMLGTLFGRAIDIEFADEPVSSTYQANN